MTENPITVDHQRTLIERMRKLVARRATEDVELRKTYETSIAGALAAFLAKREAATKKFETHHAKQLAEYHDAREAVLFHYESEGYTLARQEERQIEQTKQQHAKLIDDARLLYLDRCQHIQDVFVKHEAQQKEDYARFAAECQARAQELAALEAEGRKVVERRTRWPENAAPPPLPRGPLEPRQFLEASAGEFATARDRLFELAHLPASRFLEDGWPVLVFIFTLLASIYPLYLALGARGWIWVVGACLLTSLALAIAVRLGVAPFSRRQTLRVAPLFQQAIQQGRQDISAALAAAKEAHDRGQAKIAKNRDERKTAATVENERYKAAQTEACHTRIAELRADFARRLKAVEDHYEQELREIEQKHPREIEETERAFAARAAADSATFRQQRADSRRCFQVAWNDLVNAWTSGSAEFHDAVEMMNGYCGERFPSWQTIGHDDWRPPASLTSLPALAFGKYEFDLDALDSGLPHGEALAIARSEFELPAVLSYPDRPSLLLEAEDAGRDAATAILQNVMLRLLTSFPPGKVRFTIIDPVGLGQNFSAFMHLADYDERLVANRIWTESAHIQQRLSDLTEHMENVIQKYLRNEFQSIQDYNEQAGEVAEPFQILVVANFPANFSDESARRLVSIAASGARCGVYTLISVDMKQKLPRNFELSDLEANAATLVWDTDAKKFRFQQSDLRELDLVVESPPDDETFTSVVRRVGRLAKDASRVEVPFSTITPQHEWWIGDSRAGIDVPLGRAGARKLQHLRLGKGTSQHVLIAGKTGSGKSTLLNAMITNLALYYSPRELQFYLIDFKKGVEFKAYAEQQLPHARVVAIESEREFGMSVLQRLDDELKRRGDLFRSAAVQNLEGYRNAVPDAEMPRILLIIDEFQEFFTSDDKIAHDASLLLDRLVRQGRAFGIHVLLGSQTLAGAYSLARSTIGQMAVRIALQCSESDAHLILSEDNTAARLLSRPGEAIYNDANGLFEGNHPFQVVWLSDDEREDYLRRLKEMVDARGIVLPKPTIFEGSAPADPAENEPLHALLAQPPVEIASSPRAWLGAAVAIKEPTHALFARHSGSNLLIVGLQEELALGVMASSLVSLAAQTNGWSPERRLSLRESSGTANGDAHWPRFVILDGLRSESPHAGFFARFAQSAGLDAKLPSQREVAETIRALASEVDRRLASGEQTAEPIFLVIANLPRYRDLKKSDDYAMSFDDSGDSSAADKQLATILREGPALGVHALLWCDSFNNVNRWLDRGTLRDVGLRVLFQMGATDSSNLMDSPAASRLGVNLAILYSEEQGDAEKFRPYGLPSAAWLDEVARRAADVASRSGTV